MVGAEFFVTHRVFDLLRALHLLFSDAHFLEDHRLLFDAHSFF